MDKLLSIRMFVRAAQAGNLSRAAEELGVSRSMVTKRIAELEDSLGVRLLNRTTRKVSLTEPGLAFRDRCLQILSDLDEAETLVGRSRLEPRGTLRVAAPPSFGMFHLTPALADFAREQPQLEVELTLIDREPDLVEEGFDVAIRLGELEDSTLVAHRLARSRMVVCAAPSYLERHGRPTHPAELVNHNCLQLRYPPLQFSHWAFDGPEGRVEVPVRGGFGSNIGDVLRLAAVHGMGLVLQPTYTLCNDIVTGALEPVLEDYEPLGMDIHAVYLHRKHLSAKVSSFLSFIKQRFQGEPYWENWRRLWRRDGAAARPVGALD